MLAAHDSDGDRQLDFDEFSDFMAAFMAAAGFQLQEVVPDLVTLAQTKVVAQQLDYYTVVVLTIIHTSRWRCRPVSLTAGFPCKGLGCNRRGVLPCGG